MKPALLFRKRTPLTDDGLPWLSGDERGPWCAKRNRSGEAGVSAILIRALVAAAQQHAISNVLFSVKDGNPALVVSATSRSTGHPTDSYLILDASTDTWEAHLPNGGPDKVTYYLGLLGLAEAMAAPEDAVDLLDAYQALLDQTGGGPIEEAHKDRLCRAGDELFYWLSHQGLPVDPDHNRLEKTTIGDAAKVSLPRRTGVMPFALNVFHDPDELRDYRAHHTPMKSPLKANAALPILPTESTPSRLGLGRFIGHQARLIFDGLQRNKTILLAGPTGTGKTLAVEEVARQMTYASLTRVEGKEGMIDTDFLGNIVPRAQLRVWQDGPLAAAIQAAQFDPVLLFIDEVTRFPREQINLLIGFLNRKSGDLCRQEGLNLIGDGPFYVVRVPQDNSKVFACPCDHLLIVAAANFGKDYAVYPLDPALRRRFTMVVEFDYPGQEAEIGLLIDQAGLDRKVAEALVAVAIESRRVHENGDLPGQIDTASLIEWARKCVEFKATTVGAIMDMARLTWADLVCGRTHDGRVDQGHFDALSDHLETLGTLPKSSGSKK